MTSYAAPSGREHHTVTAHAGAQNRERAHPAILTLLRRTTPSSTASFFTITFSDGSRLRLAEKSGYDPDRALTQRHIERDDPCAWFKNQLADRHLNPAGTTPPADGQQ